MLGVLLQHNKEMYQNECPLLLMSLACNAENFCPIEIFCYSIVQAILKPILPQEFRQFLESGPGPVRDD